MRICILGLGYVGTVGLGCLANLGHRVVGVDVDETKVGFINQGKAPIVEPLIGEIIAEQYSAGRILATTDAVQAVLQADVSLVCVGTPSTEQGHLNLDSIDRVADEIAPALAQKDDFHVVAIRSTTLPGTIQRIGLRLEKLSGKKKDKDFSVVSNPEFLREGTAVKDFYDPPFTLVGSASAEATQRMREIYSEIEGPFLETQIRVAELIKYVNNAFHALKITFANEVGNICKAIDVDSRELMRIFCMDTKLNLSSTYLKPGFAYGGSCLPKDLRALNTIAHDNYLKCPVIESISESNELQKELVLQQILNSGKQKIGFLGLSFKPGTDDLRNSPIVDVIEILLGKGFDVRIFDANVRLAQLKGANKQYIINKIPYVSRFLVDDINHLIDHSEILVVVNKEPQSDQVLSKLNRGTILYDLAN